MNMIWGMGSSMGSRNTPEYQAAAEKSFLIPEMGFSKEWKVTLQKLGENTFQTRQTFLAPVKIHITL